MSIRITRAEEQLKKELGGIILHKMKDPRLGFVTVTKVSISKDLSSSRVYVSVLGDEKKQKSTLIALDKAKGFIRTEVGKKVKMRQTPALRFILDESGEYGRHIDKLIEKNAKGEER